MNLPLGINARLHVNGEYNERHPEKSTSENLFKVQKVQRNLEYFFIFILTVSPEILAIENFHHFQ